MNSRSEHKQGSSQCRCFTYGNQTDHSAGSLIVNIASNAVTGPIRFLEFCTSTERETAKKMNETFPNCDCEGDVIITFDEKNQLLSLKISLLQGQCWSNHMAKLDEVEQYFIANEKLDLAIQCQVLDDNTTLFLMHVLKLAERYQWLGEKEIRVNCDLGLGKSNRYWLKEKLRKCFELDIRFSGFLTRGTI